MRGKDAVTNFPASTYAPHRAINGTAAAGANAAPRQAALQPQHVSSYGRPVGSRAARAADGGGAAKPGAASAALLAEAYAALNGAQSIRDAGVLLSSCQAASLKIKPGSGLLVI